MNSVELDAANLVEIIVQVQKGLGQTDRVNSVDLDATNLVEIIVQVQKGLGLEI